MANGGCGQNCTNIPGSFTCSCNSGYTLDTDNRTCDLSSDCTHKWLSQSLAYSNYYANPTNSGLAVGGFLSTSGASKTVFAKSDGHILWSTTGEGYYGNSAAFDRVASNLYGGSSTAFRIENAATGATIGTMTYGVTGGSINNFLPIGFSPSGDSVTGITVTAAGAWTGSFAGGAPTGTGSQNLLIHQNAAGAYVESVGSPTLSFSIATGIADGTWVVFATNSTGSATMYGTQSIAANTTQLLTLTNHLAFQAGILMSPAVTWGTPIAVSQSGVRVVGQNGVTGYNQTTQLWNRSDCGGVGSIGVAGDVVYVATVLSGTSGWCGEHFATVDHGIAVAQLNALTGATTSIRWFPTPGSVLYPSAFVVGQDGTSYVTFTYNGTSALTICGDSTTAPGTNANAIFAF